MSILSESVGDIWQHKDKHIIIPVNLNGVFGRGISKQAKDKFPDIQSWFKDIQKSWFWRLGLPIYRKSKYSLIMFPVKYHWAEKADLDLIMVSCSGLVQTIHRNDINKVVMPRVGCGFGELDWNEVKSTITLVLKPVADKVILISPSSKLPEKYPLAFKKGVRQDKLAYAR